MIDRTLLGVQHLYKKAIYSRTKQCSIKSPDYGPLPQGAPSCCQSAFEPEGILRFVMLSDGSCYLHDLIILWPFYCTFQGTQRQNIALDNPRLLSCSHGIYFRLFWNACEQGPLQFKLHMCY
ncbi:hypothetical protein IFM89_032788 [Coptis chinensis]|uniref:Uncharacterized protein n=1 Tax=Coptis chinensis TaxID=261450 RepID=A0A835J1T2_9MAGN|nr:hypothetical protein IFM89_032788 [Coptis chinensis]